MPSPGTSRPTHAAYEGPTKPSIRRKIQTNVATLITSGTVTKKPAMKLRRIHWSMRGRSVVSRPIESRGQSCVRRRSPARYL
jgi:hypothetical protein